MTTARDITEINRATTIAQWGVATVVMVGSAISAGIGFDTLKEHAAVGVITGIGVDLALASGLVISRRLRTVGVTTRWGTILIWLTGAMTLCLNSGAAFLTGHTELAVAHAFLPILLIVLTEAGTEAQLKLHHRAEHAAEEEQAERAKAEQRRREEEQARANGVLVTAQDALNKAAELRRQVEQEHRTVEQLRTAAEADLAAQIAATTQQEQRRQRDNTRNNGGNNTRANTGNKPPSTGTASREQRRQWVRQERAAGRTPTGADVNNRFGGPRTGAAVVAEVLAEEQHTNHALRAVP